jgi:hypothetical protein
MRTTLVTAMLVATLGAPAAFAGGKDPKPAETGIAGTYDVKYDEVSNNCTQTGMSFTRGTLTIETKKDIAVRIDLVPTMLGSEPRAGKLKAQSKLGPSVIQGLDGKFSVAGRVDDGVLQFVFVAEYYLKGKPLCTQSWNVSGVKNK